MLVLLVLFCQNIMFYDKFIAPQWNWLSNRKETFREKLKNMGFKGEQGNACLKLIIRRASHFEQILSETRKGGQRN